MFEIKQHKYTK